MLRRRPFAAVLTLALVAPAAVLSTSTTAQAAPVPTPKRVNAKHLPRPTRDRSGTAAHSPHSVLVKFKPSASKGTRDKAVQSRGGRSAEAVVGTGFVKVTTSGRADELAKRLRADPSVAEVTLDYVRKTSATPNDYLYSSFPRQGYLQTVRMPSAWDRSKGSLSQVVAVVDSGVNGKHPDLVGRTVAGYDAISNVDIAAGAATDEEGHGSMVAGIIAAQTDNSEGIAGVAWNAKVMPVKVMDSNGEGSDSDVIEGITWAVDHGARIVNLSLGGPDDSPALHEAVRYAVGKGAVVIVAAGNSGDGQPEYPAAYPEAIAVAATDNAGRLTDFSTHGSWVDVAAPGFGILSTQLAGDYAYGDGTSFSAPIVSGITVLLRTQTPSITPDQIASRLRSTARDAGPRGIDPYYGAGIVDATNALGGGRTTDFPQPGNGANEPNDVPARATPLTGQATGTIGTEGDVDWYRYDATETQSLSLSVTPTAYDPDVAQNLDPVISVYDQNLRLVTDDDHHGSGEAELVGFTAGPGSYYVKVENYNGAADPRSYSLSLGTHTGRLLNAPAWLEQPTPQDGATAAGDVTGDGRDDLVTIVGAYGDDTLPRGIVVHAQTSSGTLDDGTFYPTADDSPIMRFKLADVDGDGSLDVLAGTFNGLQVLYQSGDGSLAAARYLGSIQGAQAHDVAAADLDGDGDTDVVTSIYGSPSIRMRQADGTYTEAIRFRVATFDLVIGDVDGDGRPDVVGTTGSDVRVFHNDLSGWRDTVHTATLPQGSGIGGVRLVDVDRDGRTDVIALIHSSDGSSSVATYLQAADGTLAAPTSTPLPSYSETLAAADVTGDAIPDLVTSGMGQNASVSVLPGLPGGGFGAPQTTSIGDTNLTARQGELATGDLDGDGRVDAAVMTRNGVAVLRNATAPTAVTSPALWARSTSPADFSTSVPMATTPTVTFAREVVPSSVTESTVALLDGHSGARVPATVTYDESAHTATVKPTSPLDENEPYRLTVSGVTDTSGAPMDAAYSSTFRTVDLVPPAVGSFTATGALGAATLTWQASTVTDLDHYVVRMAAGSTAPSSVTAGTALYSGTGTSVSVPNLTQGTTYSFRIWAMDRSGTYGPPSSRTLLGTGTTMSSNVTSLTYGGWVTLTGKMVRRDTGTPIAGAPIQLYWRKAGTTAWNLATTLTSSSTGAVTFVNKPSTSVEYMWVYRGSTSFVGSSSVVLRVGVRTAVTGIVSRTSLALGGTFTMSGSVAPTHASQTVYLQRYAGNGKWTTVASKVLGSTSGYAFSVKPSLRATFTYRVYKPADADHIASYSPNRAVKVT